MTFKDHFSTKSDDYARFRPRYPRSLFAYLAELAPGQGAVWDCATGNGQAAGSLAEFFDRVIATDASEMQIRKAKPHSRVEYRVASAENSGLPARSFDLVMVAQAVHWFELDAFYAEARRVLKLDGILALSCYTLLEISPQIDAAVNRYYSEIVGPYWPSERSIVETRYQTLPFPFAEISLRPFTMKEHWTLEQLTGYLRTWSATQRYVGATGGDPIQQIMPELLRAWPNPDVPRPVVWPLAVRAGRCPV